MPDAQPDPLPEATPGAAPITELLHAAGSGDALAGEQVMALLYRELQQLAHARLRRSGEFTLLDTAALVHESYLRLPFSAGTDFADRRHFFAYVARAMHSVVVDLVRARQAQRRGGGEAMMTLNTAVIEGVAVPDDEVLAVHEALRELATTDARLATVVEMRYFAGLADAEIALSLGITERTVQRDWQKARLLLSMALR